MRRRADASQSLAAKRDLFNGRRIDVSRLALPHAREYELTLAECDASYERFARTFEAEVASARETLHALGASEALQRPIALSSLTLLAEIRKRITPHTERALMKYVGRMHAKTSPFSTFCHIAPATFAPLPHGRMSARLGASTVTRRANRLEPLREEGRYFEDSVLAGEVVCDERAIDALTDTISSYVRDLPFPIRRSRGGASCGAGSERGRRCR